MKDVSRNIRFQKCHFWHTVPSSPKGEETRWGPLSSVMGTSNSQIATSQFLAVAGVDPRNDVNY
ncbi:hypothetical protein BFP97_18205 [Roseivirga sp. 4D4]|nr:hypothetical protein BFP97_18205 [Roseivirga sp. 4D4]